MISSVYCISTSISAQVPQFVAGPENALVRGALQAAVSEALVYNPLVICGPSGVGKSLLAHLLAEHRQRALNLSHVVCTTGAELARALASAAETNSVAALRTKHHRADLLLIDDVQQLATRPAAQQYLVTTIDVLVRRGILVLATLRQLPAATEDLLPTLASRLQGGLVVPLAPPEQLARRELVRQAASHVGLALSDDHVHRLIGAGTPQRAPVTAVQLRHAVLQLAAAAHERKQKVSAALIAEVLAPEQPDIKQVVRQIALTVAKHSGLTVGEIKGPVRRQAVAEARSLAMCLVRRVTSVSYAEIGRHFGGRDHTTVLHACRKIEKQAAADPALARLLAELAQQTAALVPTPPAFASP